MDFTQTNLKNKANTGRKFGTNLINRANRGLGGAETLQINLKNTFQKNVTRSEFPLKNRVEQNKYDDWVPTKLSFKVMEGQEQVVKPQQKQSNIIQLKQENKLDADIDLYAEPEINGGKSWEPSMDKEEMKLIQDAFETIASYRSYTPTFCKLDIDWNIQNKFECLNEVEIDSYSDGDEFMQILLKNHCRLPLEDPDNIWEEEMLSLDVEVI
jgi:hypothetical protein